jgi:hypothetical protein
MTKQVFGKNRQIRFDHNSDFYELLGYLAKSDGSTSIVWEDNDNAGAWGPEGRICFYVVPPQLLRAHLKHTAGSGNVISRVNCNEFVELITVHHRFVPGDTQNQMSIRSTIPPSFLGDFTRGLSL